jgi:hypothetical protein
MYSVSFGYVLGLFWLCIRSLLTLRIPQEAELLEKQKRGGAEPEEVVGKEWGTGKSGGLLDSLNFRKEDPGAKTANRVKLVQISI